MIQFAIDQNSLQQVQQQLAGFAPRLIPRLREALIPLLQNALQASAPKYFSGTAPSRGPAGNVLTSRSGNLLSSVLQSLQVTLDSATSFSISIGSDLSYAAIHEYGGSAVAGRSRRRTAGGPICLPAPICGLLCRTWRTRCLICSTRPCKPHWSRHDLPP